MGLPFLIPQASKTQWIIAFIIDFLFSGFGWVFIGCVNEEGFNLKWVIISIMEDICSPDIE